MRKILVLILTLVLVIAAAGCSSWTSAVKDFGGEVSDNGGFAVVKGDYVYFVNGSAANSMDNTFGNVVKGAIMRVKVSDLGKADAAVETVVPKIVYTDYDGDGAGLFIEGDYVYYPTPSDKRNSNGEVKNTEIEFMKTKLDGSDPSVIATVDALDTPFRFYAEQGKVYLTVYVTDTEDGESVNRFVTYAEDGSIVKKSAKISSYDLGAFGCKYAYYVHNAYNETTKQDESFNEVYRYAFDGSEDALVFNGVSGYSDKDNGIGTQGATFAIKENTADYLFVSMTYVDTSVADYTVYGAIAHKDVKVAEENGTPAYRVNYNALEIINEGDNNASAIFSDDSLYLGKNAIVYNDATYGVIAYNYQAADKDLKEGLVYLFDDAALKTYTYEYSENGYMYYSNEGYYYRLNVAALIDAETGVKKTADVNIERLTYKQTYTKGDWFKAEIIGDYMLYSKSGAPYYGYVYAVGLKDIETKYGKALSDITEEEIDEYVEELTGTEKEDIDNALSLRVGVLSEDDKASLETYYSDNFKD